MRKLGRSGTMYKPPEKIININENRQYKGNGIRQDTICSNRQ